MGGLRRSFDKALARARQRSLIQALVGKRLADGTYLYKVDGRPECIWVTMRLSSGGQTAVAAVNAPGVPHSAKLAVEMRLEGEDYVIQRKSPRRVNSNPAPSDPSGNEPHLHDHGSMGGLDDDDHTQYHNNARGDARYYTKAQFVLTEQVTLEDTNKFTLIDDGVIKWSAWSTIKTALTTLFNTLYVIAAGKAGGQTVNGGTAASENLTLDSTAHATKGNLLVQTTGGNVGIGTTDMETWATTFPAIQLGPLASVMWRKTPSGVFGSLTVFNNAYYDGTNYRYKTSTVASMYVQDAGTHNYYVAPSGTADAVITWTVALSTNNAGLTGNGTTSPQGKLHTYDGTAAFVNVSKTSVDGTSQTIMPNTAGDVTVGVMIDYIATDGTTTVSGSGIFVLLNATYAIVVSSSTYTITVASTGAITIARSAGSGTLTKLWLRLGWM